MHHKSVRRYSPTSVVAQPTPPVASSTAAATADAAWDAAARSTALESAAAQVVDSASPPDEVQPRDIACSDAQPPAKVEADAADASIVAAMPPPTPTVATRAIVPAPAASPLPTTVVLATITTTSSAAAGADANAIIPADDRAAALARARDRADHDEYDDDEEDDGDADELDDRASIERVLRHPAIVAQVGLSPDSHALLDLLSEKQQQAMEILLGGGSDTAAATLSDVDRKTISRWRRDDVLFRGTLALARREKRERVRQRTTLMVDRAAEVYCIELEQGNVRVAGEILKANKLLGPQPKRRRRRR